MNFEYVISKGKTLALFNGLALLCCAKGVYSRLGEHSEDTLNQNHTGFFPNDHK